MKHDKHFHAFIGTLVILIYDYVTIESQFNELVVTKKLKETVVGMNEHMYKKSESKRNQHVSPISYSLWFQSTTICVVLFLGK